MEINLVEELRSITRALNEGGIEYVLCGSLTMAVYGLPRATVDIDLLIATDDLSVVSREGLIRLKSLRGSGQDLDDIEFLKGNKDES